MSSEGSLSHETLNCFRKEFEANDKYRLAQNVVSTANPIISCLRREALEKTNHVFTHKVEEVKPVTNQKSSGRCWIFACLNAMRVPFIKSMNLEDFEFSQNYLFFWDKIERSNYFLHTIAESYRRSPREDPEGRLVSFLLDQPISDGGQWDMVVNLIEKHGVMPKKCFPDTWSSEYSMRMNSILKSKLREFARDIHKRIDEDEDESAVNSLIRDQMKVIYRIVSICLGSPPRTFTWEYLDKSKKYQSIRQISPQDFYLEHVKRVFDLKSKVCLVTDPRPSNPTGKTYTVDCLGNVVGGNPTIYNNQPVETLMEIAAMSIKSGEPVWFGCEVGKHMASKQGILDIKAHDYMLMFDTEVSLNMSKADRLIYGDSMMTHAMVLTGITIDDRKEPFNGNTELGGEIEKWRIENSWGEDQNEKGYIVMTNDWLREFVFEIVVDKKHCSQDILDVFSLKPTILPAWDPMGALATRDETD